MSKELDEALLEEKRKRKEVARRRTFGFVVIMDVILVAYIAIQIIFLTGAK